MISKKMKQLGEKRSSIRDAAAKAAKKKSEIGERNVFDFSLGNPSVPAPEAVKNAIMQVLESDVPFHGYTPAQGDYGVRKAIADYINSTYKTKLPPENIFMTAGAAAALAISLKAICEDLSEVITFTPFFPEYRIFTEAAGAKLIEVKTRPGDFQIDLDEFLKAVNSKTAAVILNSPNNPSGVVYTENGIKAVCDILKKKSAEFKRPVYIISDEPYRELVYGNTSVPYVMNYYDNTLVCYSFSKSLSIPGERIGYLAVSEKSEYCGDILKALGGAARALGYVCAPSLFQLAIAKCVGMSVDISVYKKNRDLLYDALSGLGFDCVHPDGAFYLFVKSLEPDAAAFCGRAENYGIIAVPGDDFGCPGYVRMAYCVKTEQIINSLDAFKKLASEYNGRICNESD